MICARIETSSAETGSSSTISFGFDTSARATAMRWRWPPLNSCGIQVGLLRAQAHGFQDLGDARLHLLADDDCRLTTSGSATMSRTRMRGFSDDQGSWKTAWTVVR